jgi:hypothetical protein
MHILDLLDRPDWTAVLNGLLASTGAVVAPDAPRMPRGQNAQAEALLCRPCEPLLPREVSKRLRAWWLAVDKPVAADPNWDLAMEATFPDGKRGLVLVEAKAHVAELAGEVGGKLFGKMSSKLNHCSIGRAIREARTALNVLEPGVRISRDRCYQFSNRIAFAWRLAATEGIPVALLYLGFTGDAVIAGPEGRLRDGHHWRAEVVTHTSGIFPSALWERRIDTPKAPLWVLTRSLPCLRQSPFRSRRVKPVTPIPDRARCMPPEAGFHRGLSDAFITALADLAHSGGWWSDVLADPKLVIAVRKERLNVYWFGQSLFDVRRDPKSGTVRAETHPKYLLDPALGGRVSLVGREFDLSQVSGGGLMRNYEGLHTLEYLKRNADRFGSDEKRGVQTIVHANPDVLDLEIGLPHLRTSGAQTPSDRIDIAALEEQGDALRLMFWEAKPYANRELWPNGAGHVPVLKQIARYRERLEAHRDDLLASYRRVAESLVAIARMSGGKRKVGELVKKLAAGAPLILGDPVDVGLVVFGFSPPEAAEDKWVQHESLLSNRLKGRLRAAGPAANIHLSAPRCHSK